MEEIKSAESCVPSGVICIDEIRNRPRNPLSAIPMGHPPALHNATDENRPVQSVIYVYDGMRRWWRIRRFQLIAALFFCIGIIIGMVMLAITVAWSG